MQPFEGIRVLDCSDESGLLAGKILADLGADVIAVEPPGGHALRHRGPFLGDQPDPERSLAWQELPASARFCRCSSLRLHQARSNSAGRLTAWRSSRVPASMP